MHHICACQQIRMFCKQLNHPKLELKQAVFLDRVVETDPLLQMSVQGNLLRETASSQLLSQKDRNAFST